MTIEHVIAVLRVWGILHDIKQRADIFLIIFKYKDNIYDSVC